MVGLRGALGLESDDICRTLSVTMSNPNVGLHRTRDTLPDRFQNCCLRAGC